MNGEDIMLSKRLAELSARSYNRGCYTFSPFLNMAQQDVLSSIPKKELPAPYVLDGGFDSAERRCAVFGSAELCGYDRPSPCVWVEIAPLSMRFAEELTHRDILGSLMSLGLDRSLMGDIIISGNTGYLCCTETAAQTVVRELTRVRHTSVSCRETSAPECASVKPDEQELVVASVRADSIVCAAFKLSRSAGRELFPEAKVYINSKQCTDPSKEPKPGDVISVRGKGRIEYIDVSRETKKGRLRLLVRIYR